MGCAQASRAQHVLWGKEVGGPPRGGDVGWKGIRGGGMRSQGSSVGQRGGAHCV